MKYIAIYLVCFLIFIGWLLYEQRKSRKVAELIIKTLKNAGNEAVLEEVRSEVKALTDAFPLYED